MNPLSTIVTFLAGLGLTSLAYDAWQSRKKGLFVEKELPPIAPNAPAPAPAASAPNPNVSTAAKGAGNVASSSFSGDYPNSGVYKSSPGDCVMRATGQFNGRLYMFEPAFDTRSGLYARLDYLDSQAWLKEQGFRLITEKEWYELFKSPETVKLDPCTLVHTTADQYAMRSLGYQKKHDDCVKAQLDKLGWNGDKLLVNCGKQWLAENPKPGGSVNFGWFQNNGKPIQGPGRAHEATYTDYSQLTMGVRL